MASARRNQRYYSFDDLGVTTANFTVGTWTRTIGSNIISYVKGDADDTSIVYLPIPRSPSGLYGADAKISVITIPYVLADADLEAAPTAVVNKISIPAATGVVARSAVTQVLTFGGDDAIGIAVANGGQHTAIITITGGLLLADDESANLELTLNAAATTTITMYGLAVTYV